MAEVVEEFDGFGGELVDVGVELFVGEEFAGGAFAALDGGDDVVDALGGRVEAGDGGARVVVDGLVGEEAAGRAAAGAQVGDDDVDLVERAVEAGDAGAGVVVERLVGEEAAGRAAPTAEVVGDGLERGADLGEVVVERRVVDEAAGRALARLDAADEVVGVAHGLVEVVVERLVVDEAAERALPLVDAVGDLGELGRELVELLHQLVAGGGERLVGAGVAARLQDRALADGAAEGRARREVDELVGAEDAGRAEARRRVVADQLGGRPAVDLAVDGEGRLDALGLVVRGREQAHVVHLADADAGEPHLGALPQPVGVGEARLDLDPLREGRDVARGVEDEEDEHADGDDDEQPDAQLAHPDALSLWRHRTEVRKSECGMQNRASRRVVFNSAFRTLTSALSFQCPRMNRWM